MTSPKPIIDREKGVIYLTERQRTEQLIKPILRGRDIKRYSYEWAGLWIIIAKFNSHQYLEKDYPTIYNHLLQHRDKLQARGQCTNKPATDKKPYTGQHHWLELDNNPTDEYLSNFEKEKIVWNPVSGEYFFTHIKETMYFNNSLFMMTDSSDNAPSPSLRGSEATEAIHKNKAQKADMDCHEVVPTSRNDKLLYILGLMNSTLYKWLITQMTNLVETGKYAYGAKDKIERLPIPKVDSKTEVEFIQIVQEILEKKILEKKKVDSSVEAMDCHAHQAARNDTQKMDSSPNAISSSLRADEIGAAIQELESKLDNLVYQLYNLSNDEIELIESIGGGGNYSPTSHSSH